MLCLLLIKVKNNPFAIPAFIAGTASFLWSAYTVYIIQNSESYIQDSFPIESIRNLSWFFLLAVLISSQQFNKPYFLMRHSWRAPCIILITISIVILESFSNLRYYFQQLIGFDFRPFVHIGFSLLGLILIEQLYRNALQEQRWAIKFICLGLASVFAFDFVLYSKALLFSVLDMSLWEARGFINALIVPMIAVSLKRLTKDQIRLQVSNKLIFHTTVLLGAGSYLLLMSLAGYYIKVYGGSWGAIAQISFIFLAIILLLTFFISGKIRALAKVYFSKHLFQHRYDYRDEWIKLSKNLANLTSLDDLSNFIINTLSKLVDSSGGGIWVKNEQGDYYLAAEQNLELLTRTVISKNESLIHFFSKKQWVIDFVEYFNDPDIYENSGLEKWHTDVDKIWLIVPLFQQTNLEGFVVLTEPRVPRLIDWDDHDLLKTVGMQLANALALTQASDNLSRARQFEAYNRFSAFLVHDLKNLVAQISLIVKNSEKHKRNPEFIDDSIETLENVVKKIDHLLAQLKKGNTGTSKASNIKLSKVLKDVAIQQASNKPTLKIEMDAAEYIINGEAEKMAAILGHLVQNAQDATADDGEVKIQASKEQQQIVLRIIDTGCGMDEKFIKQRLFKPFDTTKGNAGMGIGVYEAQEYIHQQSGKITVVSRPNEGTIFSLYLPEVSDESISPR